MPDKPEYEIVRVRPHTVWVTVHLSPRSRPWHELPWYGKAGAVFGLAFLALVLLSYYRVVPYVLENWFFGAELANICVFLFAGFRTSQN